MNTVYTTTLVSAAERRGITVKVIDPETPVFELSRDGTTIRCYNGLTDRVGAVSFILANNKILANRFLAMHGIRVPAQMKYTSKREALGFLRKWRKIVVKPASEWGGRGVSVAVDSAKALADGVRRARRFGEEVLLEQYVTGTDKRLIYVDGKFVAAIMRSPAFVTGNGYDTISALIRKKNVVTVKEDASHKIPLDAETRRSVERAGYTLASVPRKGKKVRVRLTSNYHTGGDCVEITDSVEKHLVSAGADIARLFGTTLLGIDFLVQRDGRFRVIETSPDMAVSPPEGGRVAERLLDSLFPMSASGSRKQIKKLKS